MAVEAALVIPLLVVLAFGMIELALLLRDNVAATTLAREGARTASAEPRVSTFVTDAVNAVQRSAATLPANTIEEIWVYRPNSVPASPSQSQLNNAKFPAGQTSFATCTVDCVKYGWFDPDGSGPTVGSVRLKPGSAVSDWDPTDINACLADPAAHSVGVYVRTNHPWVLGFFSGAGTKVEAWTVMKFEPVRMPPQPLESNPNLLDCKP